MWLFSPSTWFFIGYKTFPWSLSSKNPRSKPSQVNQSIKCSHLKDDGGAHTWLATVDLNESPRSLEKSDSFSYFSVVLCIFLKRHKNHISCLYILMRFVTAFYGTKSPSTAQNCISRQIKQNRLSRHFKTLSLSLKYMCNGKLEKSWFPFLLVKVNLRITISNSK